MTSIDVWFLRFEACYFGPFFTLLAHLNPPPPKKKKNQNFEKMEKMIEDIILHKCTKNHDHICYTVPEI